MSTGRRLYEKAQQSASYSAASLLPAQRQKERTLTTFSFYNCTDSCGILYNIGLARLAKTWTRNAAVEHSTHAYDCYWTKWRRLFLFILDLERMLLSKGNFLGYKIDQQWPVGSRVVLLTKLLAPT